MTEKIKQTILEFMRHVLQVFLASALLLAPIALTLSTSFLHASDREYSFKHIFLLSAIIFSLGIGFIWYLLKQFLAWLITLSLLLKRQDYFILALSLLPIMAAVYTAWNAYGGKDFLHSVRTNFQVEIVRNEKSAYDDDICILAMGDQYGNTLAVENLSRYSISGDWVADEQGCLFFSPNQSQAGSIQFDYIGRAGDNFEISFQDQGQAESVAVRVNHELVSHRYWVHERDGVMLLTPILQYNASQISVWNVIGAAGWTAVLFISFASLVLILKKMDTLTPAISFSAIVFKFIENRSWLGFVVIFVFVAFMFWPRGSLESSDVAYYLSLAKNLYHGNGYVNPDLSPAIYRGPIFPLLIGFSYLIFGESFRSAIIMERIFWALTIFITYFLGWKLFNPRVGFFAAIFVLSAVVIDNAFHFIWTDGPLVFFVLLLQFLFWQAFKKKPGYSWYISMGVLMGIAYLLKQTAALVAPLPFILWVVFSDYRTSQTLKKLLVYMAIFAIFIVGWMGYIYAVGGSSGQIIGDFRTAFSLISRFSNIFSAVAPSDELSTASRSSFSISILQILDTFYNRDIVRFFNIAILFPLVLGFTFYQVVLRKSRPDIFLLTGFLLLSYLIPSQVVANFGFRNNLYFFIIGLLGLAAMIERLCSSLSYRYASSFVAFFMTGSLVYIQVAGGNYVLREPNPVYNLETLDYFSLGYRPLANWINENVAPDEIILMSEREGNILHILTDENRRFEIINNCRGAKNFWPAVKCTPPYISFWIYNGLDDPDAPRDVLLGISEPVLVEKINNMDVNYVIVTPRLHSLYFYLVRHPDFEEMLKIDNFPIFRVISPVQPISFYTNVQWDTCIGQGTSAYLKNLEETSPSRYETKLREEIVPWMGLSKHDLDLFANWQGCQFGAFTGEYSLP
jgi:4-amino-4-deoxy-L-arabinose transferase-like glycosyltransferase